MGYGKQIATDHLTDEQRELLAGGTEPLTRGNVWGSQFTLAAPPVALSGGQPFQTCIDVGPFDEPCELLLEWRESPVVVAALPHPIYECEATVGVGRAAYTERWQLARGQSIVKLLVAQSLRVGVRRVDTGVAQDYILNLWCSRRVAGQLPVVLATVNVPFLAGVATATIDPPPPQATHVIGATDTQSTNLDILTTAAVAGATEQLARIVSNRVPQPPLAINHVTTQWRLQRAAAANAGSVELRWLR